MWIILAIRHKKLNCHLKSNLRNVSNYIKKNIFIYSSGNGSLEKEALFQSDPYISYMQVYKYVMSIFY